MTWAKFCRLWESLAVVVRIEERNGLNRGALVRMFPRWPDLPINRIAWKGLRRGRTIRKSGEVVYSSWVTGEI